MRPAEGLLARPVKHTAHRWAHVHLTHCHQVRLNKQNAFSKLSMLAARCHANGEGSLVVWGSALLLEV